MTSEELKMTNEELAKLPEQEYRRYMDRWQEYLSSEHRKIMKTKRLIDVPERCWSKSH